VKAIRFVMVGGFLGAGKTTTLGRLARFYQARGQRVGIVTNDQAEGLVDTHNLRSQGLSVAEVAGACFCCRFNDLLARVDELRSAGRPDVILAEPVGSCTDLVATVVQPLKDLYGAQFNVAPYPVLFKPSHGLKILRPSPPTPLPKGARGADPSPLAPLGRGAREGPSPLAPLGRGVGGEGPSPLAPLGRGVGGEGSAPLAPLGRGAGGEGGFSPKAAYIFHKQLEEADAVVINRIDEMPPAKVGELAALVQARYPGVPILRISARTGQGFDALTSLLDQEGEFGRRILDIDYDTYAEGEAELGWLNSSLRLVAPEPFVLDDLLLAVAGRLQQSLTGLGAEVAHLKAIGLWDGAFGVANLVSSHNQPELSLPSHCRTAEAELIINARVALDPAVLEQRVHEAVEAVCRERGAQAQMQKTQSFRPGRPQPTHRYATAK
jgi:G3E family GTPase